MAAPTIGPVLFRPRFGRSLLGFAALLVAAIGIGAAAAMLPEAAPYVVAAAALAGAGVILFAKPREVSMWVLPLLMLVPAFVRIATPAGPDITPQRIALAGCVVAAYVVLPSRGRLPRRLLLAALAFGIYTLASALLHGSGLQGINKALSYTVESALPALLVMRVVRDENDVETLITRLIGVMAVASLLAIVERLSGEFLFSATSLFFHAATRSGGLRVQGVFPHPLVLGVAIALVLPFAVGRIVDRRRPLLHAAAVAAMLLALYWTDGRGPMLAAAIGVVAFFAASRGSRRIGAVAVVAIAMLFLAPFVFQSLATAIENPTIANGGYTVDYRRALLEQSIAWMNANPFGAGPGQVAALPLYAQVGPEGVANLSLSVDNAFARYGLELGWPGLLLFALVLLALVTETRLLPVGTIRSAMLGSQVAMFAASLTVATFTWAQLLVLFWTLTGCALALRARKEPSAALVVSRTSSLRRTALNDQ